NSMNGRSLGSRLGRSDGSPQLAQVNRFDGRDNDRVARTHRVEGFAFDLALLLIERRRFHVGLDFLVRGHPARLDVVDESEMPAVIRLYGSLPGTGLELEQSLRERRAELLGNLFGRSFGVVVLEHEGVGDTSSFGSVGRLTGNLVTRCACPLAR